MDRLVLVVSRGVHTSRLLVPTVTALCVLLVCGCGPREPETWAIYFKSNAFQRYQQTEILPVGSRLELTYHRDSLEGEGFPLALDSVRSSNPDVIRVVEYSRANPPYTPALGDGTVVLEAVSPGSTLIEMKGASNDDVFSGGTLTVEVKAANASRLEFKKNRCLRDDVRILVGEYLHLVYDLFDERGRTLYENNTGEFYRFEPQDAMAVRTHGYMAAQAGSVTVQSQVDDSSIDFQIYPESSITGATILASTSSSSVLNGRTNYLALKTQVMAKETCADKINPNVVTVEVTSLTPTVCTFEGTSTSHRDFKILFGNIGQCKVDFALPNARNGEGLTVQYEAEVVDHSSE